MRRTPRLISLLCATVGYAASGMVMAATPSEPPEEPAATLPVPEEEMLPPWERKAPDAGRGEGAPEASQTVPDETDLRANILADLYAHLAKSKDADTAAAIAGQIERLWFVSGSDTIDLLMQRALQAMSEQKLGLALKLLSAVTELQPDYAEGWNRRAVVYYKMNDKERSLGDLRRALALEPMHYKALEGVANILREQGSKKPALEVMRKLIEMHPFLPGVSTAVEELTREVEGQGI